MKFSSSYFLLIYCVQDVFSLTTIETIPPTPDNILAISYSGLVVRAMFEKTTSTTNCGWRYNGDTTSTAGGTDSERLGALQFHIVGIGCYNRTASRQSITCVEREIDGATHIITNLTCLQTLTSDLVLAVRCSGGADLIIALPKKTVRDCPHNFPNGVIASTSKLGFNTTGTFACNNNDTLFYPNGSRPSSLPNHITCLYTAEWSEQEAIEDLQCWTAPATKIREEPILNVIEGENLNITCQYNDVVPQGTSSIIYFNGNAEVIGKDEMFIISSLQLDDDKKQISFQAITLYTQMYNATGRSPNYTINVQYISDRIVAEVFSSPYLIKIGFEYLVQRGQVLTINCSRDGNPKPQCVLSVCLDMKCTNVTSNTENECVINQTITEDISFSCLAFNKAGSLLTDAQNITVISKSRSVNVTSAGNLMNTNLIRRKGEELRLSCSIDHADVLNTKFMWKYGLDKQDSNFELNLPSLKPSDGGNYTCFTQDAFGNFSATIYVDVFYSPMFNIPISCIWKMNENGTCEVTFMSNPSSTFVSVIKINTGVGIYNLSEDKVELVFNSNFEQVFVFKSPQVTLDDAGTYVLNLNSPVPPHNHKITFDIFVTDDGYRSDVLVIALSVAGGTCFLLVFVFLLWKCKPWENRGKMKGGSSSHENQAFQEDGLDNQSVKDIASPLHATSIHATDGDAVYAAVVKNKKNTASKKEEEKSNPLYATSAQVDVTEPAYGVVDKTRKKKLKVSTEKEEKSNPLYASSSHTEEVEPAYGVVDKSKKKKVAPANKQAKNAQKASLQPANQREETYAAVDRKKKKSTVRKTSQGGAGPSTSKDHVEEAYGEVKKKHNQNNQTEQDSVYAEVRKPKKKKKKRQITQQIAESGGTSSAFHDVTLHGTTQQE